MAADEVMGMISERQEPIEERTRRQIHREISSLRSIGNESSFTESLSTERSEAVDGADEARELIAVSKLLEEQHVKRLDFESKFYPGAVSPIMLLRS
jgi:hypothetical protein